MKKIKRIGILTGGGDAPGLNAVIRAAVKSSWMRKWEVIGIRQGFEELLKPGLTQKILPRNVSEILRLGGTILGTTNRGNPFNYAGSGSAATGDRSGGRLPFQNETATM